MPVSECAVRFSAFAPKSRDLILLPWLDAKTPAFTLAGSGLADLGGIVAPPEAGGSRLLYAGLSRKVGKKEVEGVAVRGLRLDEASRGAVRTMKTAVAKALDEAESLDAKRVVVLLDAEHEDLVRAVQEGARLGGYAFDTYLQKKKTPRPVVLFVPADRSAQATIRKTLAADAVLFDAVNHARDILNEPPNVIRPDTLAKTMQTEGRDAGLTVKVWEEARLKKERCGGILGVGQGSVHRPRLVWMEYHPRGAKTHLALVGKGVTFDTGGYCLKPGPSQVGMKLDMGGAAAVYGAALAIARLRLPIRLTALCPLVENRISDQSFLTTDILTTRTGRTVQVDNTDAEGRLILADALALACEEKPDYLLDAATLTGACVMALGEDIAACYGTESVFTGLLLDAAESAGEYLWEMPLHKPYAEQLKTPLADCKNLGGKWGGSITAALFLQQWVREGQRWIHCDIAGPGIQEEPHEHLGKGAKGYGVKMLVRLAESLAEVGA